MATPGRSALGAFFRSPLGVFGGDPTSGSGDLGLSMSATVQFINIDSTVDKTIPVNLMIPGEGLQFVLEFLFNSNPRYSGAYPSRRVQGRLVKVPFTPLLSDTWTSKAWPHGWEPMSWAFRTITAGSGTNPYTMTFQGQIIITSATENPHGMVIYRQMASGSTTRIFAVLSWGEYAAYEAWWKMNVTVTVDIGT